MPGLKSPPCAWQEGYPGVSLKTVAGSRQCDCLEPVRSPTTRIISDLHYADCTSAVKRIASLKPLLEGPSHVIVNGDALDTQVTENPAALVAEMKQFFARHVEETVFIAGNHDPDISSVNEVQLADGRIWVTHGHVFFDDVAPWSRLVPEIRRRLAERTAKLAPGDWLRLETRYQIFREVCAKLPPDHDPTLRGQRARFNRIGRAVFPPHRLLKIFQVWRDLPRIVAGYAREQRPQARVIITGHTHHPGVWHLPNDRTVINTGCFCPPRGGRLVDLVGERVIVRRIEPRGGHFHVGSIVSEFTIPSVTTAKITAHA